LTTPQNRTVDRAKHAKLARQIRKLNAQMNEPNTIWFVDDENTQEALIREYMLVAPLERILSMVKAGDIPKNHHTYGSPLTLAAELGLFDLIKPLHALGCSPDDEGSDGWNALSQAFLYSQVDPTAKTVLNLIDIGAKLNGRGTLLRRAAEESGPHVVRALLARGRDVNEHDALPDGSGDSPLLAALRSAAHENVRRAIDVIKELLAAGADPNAVCTCYPRGDSEDAGSNATHEVLPVHRLAKITRISPSDADELVHVLVEHGMELNHRYGHLHHPLTICAREGNDVMARALLEHGATADLAVRDRSSKYFVETADYLPLASIDLFAMSSMPRSTDFLIENRQADPEHIRANGSKLIHAVKDIATREVLSSAITAKIIGRELGGAPTASAAPRKTNLSL
jgi:ankyrin repeat protein